jgi:ATP-dependent DNA ligase
LGRVLINAQIAAPLLWAIQSFGADQVRPSRSCIIDGEAVACDDNGVALFDLVRHHRANDSLFLYAFDLI